MHKSHKKTKKQQPLVSSGKQNNYNIFNWPCFQFCFFVDEQLQRNKLHLGYCKLRVPARFCQFCCQAAQQNQGCQKFHIRSLSPAPVMVELFKTLGHPSSKEKKPPQTEHRTSPTETEVKQQTLLPCSPQTRTSMNKSNIYK